MPFTFLAHQAPVLAIKRRWPASFDGTALAFGSMSPDWAYALSGSRLAFDAHSARGIVLFCIPLTVLAATVFRTAAPALFRYVPSPRHLPLRQLRVLGFRRPALVTTVISGGFGALTHVLWDAFTHNDRWGPKHIEWLRSTAVTVAGQSFTWAKVLQYTSHVLGSAVALLLLARILRSGSLLDWYGIADGGHVQQGALRGTALFMAVAAAGLLAGGFWALGEPGLPAQIMRVSTGLGAGLAGASFACRRLSTM